MAYLYEQLNPERFQQFCQALLVESHPDTQCFPVGQPDGGRDAVSRLGGMSWRTRTSRSKDLIVFQVKFSRDHKDPSDARDWLLGVVKSEAPKLARLISRGVSEFVLLTNVPGTAHLDAGSIDQLQQILDNNFEMPARCLWRDDLDRRVDSSTAIKWSFSELLTGRDMLQHILEQHLSESIERRLNAIRTFLTGQYSEDEKVRFRQVELQNDLLDLFIDVPFSRGRSFARRVYLASSFASSRPSGEDPEHYEWGLGTDPHMETAEVGAASSILGTAERHWPVKNVVIEGAPGQGKSTIAQYVCQVHRMRVLGKIADLKRISDSHRACEIKLPLKVDLRDYATWYGRENPFEPGRPINNFTESLESFLCELIRHHSGGVDFNVADLQAILKYCPVLIVLDGFDEIADIGRREKIVDAIIKAVDRMEELCTSLQVVITSRPAAFAKSPGFPVSRFTHYSLDSVTTEQAKTYADKWMKARRLNDREQRSFKRVFDERIEQPHLKGLARNPMQLAILLSLIHTRGTSLPDKRTSIYDQYVDLFFSREAEKSEIVREHRDLLISIHGYLGWLIHGEVEKGYA